MLASVERSIAIGICLSMVVSNISIRSSVCDSIGITVLLSSILLAIFVSVLELPSVLLWLLEKTATAISIVTNSSTSVNTNFCIGTNNSTSFTIGIAYVYRHQL